MNERLCMLYEEDCRTAVFGKTERTVGWEGDGGFCDWVPAMESDRSTSHPFTLDAVIHCHSRRDAEQLLRSVAERLGECGLELHPAKSKVVYCKDSNRHGVYENVQFVFLGFCFRPRCAPSRSGMTFTSFLPAISNDAKKNIRQSIRRWCLQGLSTFTLVDIADRFNPVIRGWINYYGAFYKKELGRVLRHLDNKLVLWVQRKFTQFRRHRMRALRWLELSLASQPNLFAHWKEFSVKYA